MFSKLVILLFSFIICTYAAVIQNLVAILQYRANLKPNGSFRWSYESSDGSKQEQEGNESIQGGQVIQGSFEHYDPDGALRKNSFVADERGYIPSSEDLPVGPPIPDYIVRSLERNAAHPEEESPEYIENSLN
ncbi:hypothetical protein ABEB36_002931 [Hypothenemus hampei]|uniref:Uncharacterized protein n=1 Tax=Hypothenemus hampei TaxID=57062 RepID=A0ABD1FA44_HYPHA